MPTSTRTLIKAAQNKAEQARSVEIVHVPEDLRDVPERIRVRGEVVRKNNDGSVRVRTDYGDVDIRHPKAQSQPNEGQRVELEIQPGNPPREASVITTTAQPQNQQAKPPITEAQRSTATPVNIEVAQNASGAIKAVVIESPSLATVAGSSTSIRLQALSPQDATNLIAESTLQVLTTTLTAPHTFQAELIAIKAVLSTQNIAPTSTKVITSQKATTLKTAQPVPAPQIEIAVLVQNLVQEPISAQASTLQNFIPQIIAPNIAETSITLDIPSPRPALNLFALTGLSIFETGAPATLTPQTQQTTLPLPTITALSFEGSVLVTNTPATPPQASDTAQPEGVDMKVKVQSLLPPRVELTPSTPETSAAMKDRPPPTPITENLKAGTIRAVVSGVSAENIPVLHIALPYSASTQNFALHIPAPDIPVGTQIDIMPQTAPLISGQTLSIVSPTIPTLITPGQWPLLHDVQQAVAQLSTASAQVISNITPSPANPAQFMPAALFFLSAVRSGDIGGWLGEKTMELLRSNGRGNLVSRIASESGMLARLAAEPISQEWRALPLPLAWDNEMQKVTLFYRREENSSENENSSNKQTRFIFDLNLSNMGPVQVDGLFRAARLDVILRTQESLSEPMQMEMRRIYSTALKQTEVTGELSFQDTPSKWVKINVDEKKGEGVVA